MTVLQHILEVRGLHGFCNLPCCASTLFSFVSSLFYPKICSKALSIGPPGTKTIAFCENNAYFDSILWRWNWIFDLMNCKHSVLLLNQLFFRDCCSFTLMKLYVFLETLSFFTSIQSCAFKGETAVTSDEPLLLDLHSSIIVKYKSSG